MKTSHFFMNLMLLTSIFSACTNENFDLPIAEDQHSKSGFIMVHNIRKK